MTVDPDNVKAIKPHLIDYERPCKFCGYNLMGLMSNATCPECGRKIQQRKQDTLRYSDNLVNAPMAWLGVLASGSLVLFLSSLGVFFATAIAAWLVSLDKPIGGIVSACIGVAWCMGVWLTTRPRPVTRTTVVHPSKEWAVFRWGARASQPAWIAAGASFAFAAHTGDSVFVFAALASVVVGALGLIPLCGYLSNIAYWASDTTLAGHFRSCAWVTGFSAFLTTVHIINIFTRSILMGGFFASIIAAFLIFFVVAPYFYMIFCCFQLQGIARWAMMNHVAVEGKTQRLRERAARLAQVDDSAKPPPNLINEDAFNLGDSDVSSLRPGPATPAQDTTADTIPLAPSPAPTRRQAVKRTPKPD